MKKFVIPFVLGIVISVPLTVSAAVMSYSNSLFPDVDENAWYASSIETAWTANWMNGYENGNFGPENPVIRAEMATILNNYDDQVQEMHSNLQNVLCLNKNNSLEQMGLQVTDEAKYSASLENFCESDWNICGNSSEKYDASTGEYYTDTSIIGGCQ